MVLADTYAIEVDQGKTYLLRIITNVLLRANKPSWPFDLSWTPVDNKIATAILQYTGIPNTIIPPPTLPQLPALSDTYFALNYNAKLRSLNSPKFQANVPLKVDRHLFYTIGLGLHPLPNLPEWNKIIGLLQAHYYNLKRVFTADFPDRPPTPFNYTGAPLTANLQTTLGQQPRLSKIAFNSTAELVIQDTNLLSVESHPFHLHGYNFFVVGSGIRKWTLQSLTWLILLKEIQLVSQLVVGLP
ncbi:hypothetical protein ACS0TY_003743 [Phlomoides rotata]